MREVSSRIVCAWLSVIAIVGVAGLLVARELSEGYYLKHPGGTTSALDLFEFGLMGIVAVLCLGYTGCAFITWAMGAKRRYDERSAARMAVYRDRKFHPGDYQKEK